MLAVTSPAHLHTLPQGKKDLLRSWLLEHGTELMQFLFPGRSDPLYIVTGQILSSSWATATYSQLMLPPDDLLVLTHFGQAKPPYQWSKAGNTRNRSKGSPTTSNDQCLFLQGFLITLRGQTGDRSLSGVKVGGATSSGSFHLPPRGDLTCQNPATDGSNGGSSAINPFLLSPRINPQCQTGRDRVNRDLTQHKLVVEQSPSLSPLVKHGQIGVVTTFLTRFM